MSNKTMSMPHFPNPISQLAQSTLPMPRQRYLFSSILQGYGPNNTPVVGFSDAAVPQDGKIGTWKNAGLGVFVDLRATSLACSVHIQANTQVLSVLMAELNALLLGAKAAALLLGHSFGLVTGSLLAVQYLQQNLSQVPWRLRPIISEIKILQDIYISLR